MKPVDPADLVVSTPLASRLRQHVEYLADPDLKGRKPGTPGNRNAAQYLEQAFRQAGLEPLPSLKGYRQTILPSIGDNVVGIRRALGDQSAQWLLLGAHYDHLGEMREKIYPGADDNASGVAILLEVANAVPALSHSSLIFVAFNSEEPPFIRTPNMGSQYFVDHLPPEIGRSSTLHAVIILDLMGGVYWRPLLDTIFAAGAELSAGLYRHLKEALRTIERLNVRPIGLHAIEEIPVIGRMPFSDYDAFRLAGVPFLFLTAGRTPRYHQPTDTPDTLHYERMGWTCQWIHLLLKRLDGDPHPFGFEEGRLEFQDELETLRPLLAQAASWDTRIPGTSALSLARLKMDVKWIQQAMPDPPTPQTVKRLEHACLRMQCLLAGFPGGFLL